MNDTIVPGVEEERREYGRHRGVEHLDHGRHDFRARATHGLYGEMEDRTRRHGVPLRQPRLVEADRRSAEARPCPTCSSSPTRPTRSISAQQLQKGGSNVNPYEGLITAGGLSPEGIRRQRELEVLRRHLPGRDRQGGSRRRAHDQATERQDRRHQRLDPRRMPDAHDVPRHRHARRALSQHHELDRAPSTASDRSRTADPVTTRRSTPTSTPPTTPGDFRSTTRHSETPACGKRSHQYKTSPATNDEDTPPVGAPANRALLHSPWPDLSEPRRSTTIAR